MRSTPSRRGVAMRARRIEEHERAEALRTIPILSRCSDEELQTIDALGTDIRIAEGHTLMREDSQGFECAIILEGTVRVSRHGETVAELGPGAIVGEVALLQGGRRNATVTAATPVRALVMNAAELDALGHRLPGIKKVLLDIAAERSVAAE